MTPTLLLVAHGTRDEHGTSVLRALAARVAERTPAPVRLAFADVRAPDVARVAAGIDGPLVVVPAFLAAGYHVRLDIPAQLARAGRSGAAVADCLGADPRLLDAAQLRLRQAGRRGADAVVLAAAGSSDPAARAQVEAVAERLARRLGADTSVGYAAAAAPTVAAAVDRMRARGHSRVAVASWLLAPGLFQARLAESGADAVAAPLCPDAGVADAVVARFREPVGARPPGGSTSVVR